MANKFIFEEIREYIRVAIRAMSESPQHERLSSTAITCVSDIQRQPRVRVPLEFARVRFESRIAAWKRSWIPRRMQEKVR